MVEVLKHKPRQAKQASKARIRKPAFDAALQFATDDNGPQASAGKPRRQTNKRAQSASTIRADSLLPVQSEHVQRFKQRAAKLAGKQVRQKTTMDLHQFQQFHIGREAFGIPYRFLEEIMYATEITSVPCTPEYVSGVIALASEFLCVIDLGILFQSCPTPLDGEASIIVVSGAGIRAGLLVSRVDENESYHSKLLSKPMRSQSPVKRIYVQGIFKQTVTFLDIDAMLADLGTSIAA